MAEPPSTEARFARVSVTRCQPQMNLGPSHAANFHVTDLFPQYARRARRDRLNDNWLRYAAVPRRPLQYRVTVAERGSVTTAAQTGICWWHQQMPGSQRLPVQSEILAFLRLWAPGDQCGLLK